MCRRKQTGKSQGTGFGQACRRATGRLRFSMRIHGCCRLNHHSIGCDTTPFKEQKFQAVTLAIAERSNDGQAVHFHHVLHRDHETVDPRAKLDRLLMEVGLEISARSENELTLLKCTIRSGVRHIPAVLEAHPYVRSGNLAAPSSV